MNLKLTNTLFFISRAMIQKITQSSQTILAQLGHLTQATKQQIQKFEKANNANKKLNKNRSQDSILETGVGGGGSGGVNAYFPEFLEINAKLSDAYRNLDKTRKKLRKVKSLVFHEHTTDSEGADNHDENVNDADWFKLKEM